MSDTVFCPACGTKVPSGRFCFACGEKLPAVEPQAAAPPPAPEPAAAPKRKTAKAAAGAPQSTGLREWLGEHAATGPSMIFYRPEGAETLATALRRVRDQRALPDDIFKTIHGALQLKGFDGVYTVALGSLSWHRLDGGQWVGVDRPQYLYLPGTAIEQAASAARPGVPVVVPGGSGS